MWVRGYTAKYPQAIMGEYVVAPVAMQHFGRVLEYGM